MKAPEMKMDLCSAVGEAAARVRNAASLFWNSGPTRGLGIILRV